MSKQRTTGKTRRGPLETVTHRRIIVPIYKTPSRKANKTYTSYTAVYTAAGKRCRKVFSDLQAARVAAREIAEQLAEGTGHAHSLTPLEVADYIAAKRVASTTNLTTLAGMAADYAAAMAQLPEGVTLRDAVASYRARHDREAALTSATVEQLVERFQKSREAAGASDRYREDIRARLTKFAQTFRCQIASITASEITAWLEGLNVSGRTRNNYRGAVVALFSFARRQGCLPRNEQTEAEFVETATEKSGKIGIYTPDELRALLDQLPESAIPAIAVGAFAGLRSAEIFRLDWAEVDLARKHIVVAADKAKTSQRRLVPIVPALGKWLTGRSKKAGKVVGAFTHFTAWDRSLRREFAEMNARLSGAGAKPISRVHNGLRHSFASYRLAAVKSAAQVALEMGNSPRKLFEHYRELVTEEDATAWFNVMPRSRVLRKSTKHSKEAKKTSSCSHAAQAP